MGKCSAKGLKFEFPCTASFPSIDQFEPCAGKLLEAVSASIRVAVPVYDAWQRRRGRVRLIVWCRECGRQVEPTPAMVTRYGAETTVPKGATGLSALRYGSRQVDMVVTRTERRKLTGHLSSAGSFRGLIEITVPRVGFEPTTYRLRSGCSTAELPGPCHAFLAGSRAPAKGSKSAANRPSPA
jgi:hypothetical protein